LADSRRSRAAEEGAVLSSTRRWREILADFSPAFWVANFTEIFERVGYYSTQAVLAIFLTEQLHFSAELTGWMMGITGLVVYSLPILAGTLADRFGFRRALMFAYLLLTVGYFMLGSVTAPWMAPLRHAMGDKWLVLAILLLPALGPGMVKPCVAGTTARTSTESARAVGYSIYYTLVNIGGAIGPYVAFVVREQLGLGMENVFRVAALSVFAMFWVTLFFYHEPPSEPGAKVASLWQALKNMAIVLKNARFVIFLLITSGFYIVFWQIWISAPIFLRTYVNHKANVDRMLSVEALTVISLQIVITYFTRKMPAVQAIALGFLITGLSFALLAIHPSVWIFPVMLVVLALGEITQASRYYEYCSLVAPPGQAGLYMGYAFLPIAIGYFVAGALGGYLLREFGTVLGRPAEMWWVIVAIGVLTAAAMWIFDAVTRPAVAVETAA
jgi:proton-dependent oligopeptide transporter, POT family